MTWRYLTSGGVGAADGLAGDEVLARGAGEGRSPPTLRLYTYRPHCVLVGRFQDVRNEVRLEACAALDIDVGRRPTGGGTILMGPDQLGVALALHGSSPRRPTDRHGRNPTDRGGRNPIVRDQTDRDGPNTTDRGGRDPAGWHGRPREVMARFSSGLRNGLRRLGIDAGFRGKNDLEVGGRKIAGLGLYRDPGGGLLLHASLLVDLDVALMARVLRLPFDTFTESELRVLARRTTTVRELAGAGTEIADVRAHLVAGFAESFGVTIEPGRSTAAEVAATEALARDKYATDGWIMRTTAVPDRAGIASLDTPDGRIELHVELAGRMIKSVHVRGDFIADDAVLADLEWRLRWCAATGADIERAVRAWSAAHGDAALAPAAITGLVSRAAGVATGVTPRQPYGCFVSPGGGS